MNNIERFESIVQSIKRDGIDKLLKYFRTSDFYTAPASTRFHSCHEGGLLEHSLNVYDCLKEKKENPIWKDVLVNLSDESIAIISLFHDICKTHFYEVSSRNVKNELTGKWEKVPYYTVNDKMPIGHGEKSAFILQKFIQLTDEEFYAIRWHMGFTEPKENWNTFTAAVKKYPVCLAVHMADLESTYLKEDEK